jgi:arabinofuranosyltransferase
VEVAVGDNSSVRTRPRWRVAAALAGLLAITIVGAWQLAFLCDDAFIHFRYVANAHAGHGLVWNAPPFLPVEGMGFLWTMLLWAVWSWFGIEPPDAANVLSIGLGALQFAVLAVAALQLRTRDGSRAPAAVGFAALIAIATNRTFLQWFSGGLDTALFNLPYVVWVLLAFRAAERRGTAWWWCWSTCASFAALTRPDGLLLVAATLGAAALTLLRRRAPALPTLLALLPLLTVDAHAGWRRWFYGEWLPNTYYAKVTTPWPDAGLRWLGCFALENGAWLWLPITAVWLVAEAVRGTRGVFAAALRHLPAAAAVAVVLSHAGYYVWRVGGDHFEYRVLSALVPLGTLACVAMIARLSNSEPLPIATALVLVVASSFGWLHFALTRDMTRYGVQALTPQVPAMLRPVTRWFDHQQMWLFCRYVGLRCTFHACVLHQNATLHYPRRMTIAEPPDPFPIAAGGAVGYLGWQLRDVAVIDLLGLNDWVIARTPPPVTDPAPFRERLRAAVPAADVNHDHHLDAVELQAALRAALGDESPDGVAAFVLGVLIEIHARDHIGEVDVATAVTIGETVRPERLMAHEHHPPPGYVDAFEPNVTITAGVATAAPRRVPMTAERLRAIEHEWRQRFGR